MKRVVSIIVDCGMNVIVFMFSGGISAIDLLCIWTDWLYCQEVGKFGGLRWCFVINFRLRRLWPMLMSGNGSSACYCAVKQTKRLFLEIEKTGETMSRFQILLEGWDFIGNGGSSYFLLTSIFVLCARSGLRLWNDILRSCFCFVVYQWTIWKSGCCKQGSST